MRLELGIQMARRLPRVGVGTGPLRVLKMRIRKEAPLKNGCSSG